MNASNSPTRAVPWPGYSGFSRPVTGQLGVMISLTGIGDVYIKIIMKIIGITFITQLISDVCRDNGFNAAASQLEIMCKIAVATISIPIVLSLMEMINKCIK